MIKESLYVDDLVSGANTIEEALNMSEAGMNLRKWNSNSTEMCMKIQRSESQLQEQCDLPSAVSEEESFAKSETTLPKTTDGSSLNKLFGLGWGL